MHYLSTKKAKELYKAVLLLKNEDECKRFLGDLLTPAEIKEFSNRWTAAQMLDKKVAYEKIAKATGMSSTTIARIQKWLNGKLQGYRLMLNKMNKQNKEVTHHTRLLAV